MNSWKARLKNYNIENNIVQLDEFQKGGAIQNSENSIIPSLDDEYYNTITLNGVSYSLENKTTVQMIKKIINFYNEK
tara:strand:- start:454 stop:684 length:231 start_codon:yes stop_codon:yes gene_type:complete